MRFLTFPVSFLVAVAYGPSSIDAFPTGAGGCAAGAAAVGGTHLANVPILTGTLADGGFSVVVDDTTFPSSLSLEIGQEYTIYVRGSQFRGVLIMSDATPDDVSLAPFDDLLQVAAVCEAVGYPGITHTNSDIKTEVEGVLFCLTEGTYNFGVTVVVSNNAQEGSTYYYTGFPVVCGGGGSVAPGAPSMAPAETEIPVIGGPDTTTPPAVSPSMATEIPVIGGPDTTTPPAVSPSMAPEEADVPVIGGPETTTPPAVETDTPPGSETTAPPASSATSTTVTLLLSLGAATAAVMTWSI